MRRVTLPIDSHLETISKAFQEAPSVILSASPGSGKTTRVPPVLLPLLKPGQMILILEPRRIAAKLSAQRVAYEMGEETGQTVGYHFRFERVAGPKTRILFLTEGMLLRLLISDPHLEKVGIVLLDEFHERHIHADVALAYLKKLQLTSRPDLKVGILSATLEIEALQKFLVHPKKFEVDAPRFPVEIQYTDSPVSRRLEDEITHTCSRALRETPEGDILVFLPGMAEIRKAESQLRQKFQNRAQVHLLHGDLSVQEQTQAITRGHQRKIILSTNIAESSVTIEGVRVVVDAGLHRQASYSWWSGVPSLHTRPIAKASAIQRAGRAGRTAPGFCFRLYTRGDYDSRAAFDRPEIQRADLSQTLLELISLGVHQPMDFDWFESPSKEALQTTLDLLESLELIQSQKSLKQGASSGEYRLTARGEIAVQIPLHPRLARFLISASEHAVLDPAISIAAFLQEGELPLSVISDWKTALLASHPSSIKPLRERIENATQRLLKNRKESATLTSEKQNSALSRSLLSAYPDRVAKKRVQSHQYSEQIELLMCTGGIAKVTHRPELQSEDYFLVLEAKEKKRLHQNQIEFEITTLCPIHADWLLDIPDRWLKELNILRWDAARKSVRASLQLTYGELILSEEESTPKSLEAILPWIASQGLELDWQRLQNVSLPEFLETLSNRLRAHKIDPLPLCSLLVRMHLVDETVKWTPRDLLLHWLESAETPSSLHSLLRTLPEHALLNTLPQAVALTLNQDTPEFLTLPSGRKAPIHYEWGQKPWVESRLQDFFGMVETPTLLKGRMPLVIRLLAPNYRPVQVTQDLASFWSKTYPEVRKELSRRYPRHAWPENPRNPSPKKP